jgi:hypothetical protein
VWGVCFDHESGSVGIAAAGYLPTDLGQILTWINRSWQPRKPNEPSWRATHPNCHLRPSWDGGSLSANCSPAPRHGLSSWTTRNFCRIWQSPRLRKNLFTASSRSDRATIDRRYAERVFRLRLLSCGTPPTMAWRQSIVLSKALAATGSRLQGDNRNSRHHQAHRATSLLPSKQVWCEVQSISNYH